MERHLKKVYDCLNIGCNKKAVQEVDRLPKKVKDLAVFRALKALALIRMQKRRLAFDILNEIKPETDLDEVTLQTMTSCYKESFEVARIVDLYEAALKKKPDDQDTLVQLFMAYVRTFNFKRQKEIALALHKSLSKKSRLYTFWAIVSLVMQAQDSNDPSSPDSTVCLKLAERMCERMIDDKSTNDEIELYLKILHKQQRSEEEYRFLTGPICLRITDHLSWYNRRRAFLCLDLKMYSRAFKHYFPSLIQEYPEQIEYYRGLFKSALALDTEISQHQTYPSSDQVPQPTNQSSPSMGTPVKSSSALAECIELVERQCSLNGEGNENGKDSQKSKSQSKGIQRASSLNSPRRKLLRGPHMARIELYHTILSKEDQIPSNVFNHCKTQLENKFPNLEAILLDYFQNFSKKTICSIDLSYMINEFELDEAAKKALLASIGDWVRNQVVSQDLSMLDLYYIDLNFRILCHCFRNYCPDDKKEDRLKLAREYIECYDRNRHHGKDLTKTEFQPVDNLCILAINSIMTNSVKSICPLESTILDDKTIITLIVLAENAISNSPSNHQLKLTLLKLYSFIGASKECSDILFSLDVKHFQIDTLGHLLNPVLYNTGNYALSKESLDTCSGFYSHGIRECYEGLTQSYKDGRFSKIGEVGNVLKRLTYSLNFIQCNLLKCTVAIVNASNSEELKLACQSIETHRELYKIFGDSLSKDEALIRDNRDFRVLRSLHSETERNVRKKQLENLEDEKSWMRMRFFMLYSIQKQQECLSSGKAVNMAEFKELSDKLMVSRNKLLEAVNKQSLTEESNKYSYFEPELSPFRWRFIDVESLLDLVIPLISIGEPSALNTNLSERFTLHLDTVVNSIEKQVSSTNSLVHIKQTLLSLTVSLEFISMVVTSLHFISNSSLVTNSQANAQAKSTPGQSVAKPKSVVNQLINKTEGALTRLSSLVKSLESRSSPVDALDSVELALISNTKYELHGEHLTPLMHRTVSII